MNAPDRPLHGAPVPFNRLHPRLYAAEALGTALLVFVGLSCVIAWFAPGSVLVAWVPSPALRRALAGACFGTVGACIAVSPLGRCSGAHINPAVSLAFFLEGRLSWRDLAGYVLAQMAGAVPGAALLALWGHASAQMNYGITVVGPDGSLPAAFGGELFATVALVWAIFITAAHERSRAFTPWTIPPLFAWLVWWEAPLSGASANPARSFGPALIAGQWPHFWIYLAAPTLGALLAIGVLRLEWIGRHRVPVAKLFHFETARGA